MYEIEFSTFSAYFIVINGITEYTEYILAQGMITSAKMKRFGQS